MKLKNKVAVITGGAGGIGLSTARRFLDEGALGVMLVDINGKALKDAKASLDSDHIEYCVADISTDSGAQKYIRETEEKFGRLDILFLNAGVEGVVKPLTEYPEEEFDKVMNVNVKGVWLGLKHGFPLLKKCGGGSVIITSSVAGVQGTPNVMAYVTSKHAVVGSMKVAALEGADHNIRVNTVHPAPVDNRMMRSLEEGFAPGDAENAKKGFEQSIPMKRYAKNEEVAGLVLFLASDESSYITGSCFSVDGGMTA
jgi:NAD(P)-dependent dehydrogenase (short-subunit alcohol dehydrogenase family)